MNTNQPIGVFDSGLGGLTVLQQLQYKLPNESFVYIGDTAHVPYGNKSDSAIMEYSYKLSQFLLQEHSVKMIIVACNTASAITIESLRNHIQIPVLDVITPMQHLLLQSKELKRIGIIGTNNTIKSKSYDKLLLKVNPRVQIFSKACPLFVPLIEEGLFNHELATLASKEYLDIFNTHKIEALILGCTHYPIMKKTIKSVLNANITILDSAEVLADYTAQYLSDNHLLAKTNSGGKTKLLVTDTSEYFNDFASKILNNNFQQISNIQIF